MTMDLTCGRCWITAPRERVSGIPADPAGWSVVTVSGVPMRTVRTCPECSEIVRAALTAPEVTGRHHAFEAV